MRSRGNADRERKEEKRPGERKGTDGGEGNSRGSDDRPLRSASTVVGRIDRILVGRKSGRAL